MAYGDYPDLGGVKKILVIQLRHLGDVLLTTPVLSALKRALPQGQIDVYLAAEAKSVLEGHPAVSQLIGTERKGIWSDVRLLGKLWKRGYDCVFNLTEGDRAALAVRASRARVRVGYAGKKLYTHEVKQAPGFRHRVERNLDVVRRIGIFPTREERELFFHIPEEARRAVEKKVEGPFVLIHPTSRWRFKCWPMGKMRALTEWLLQEGKQVVLTSGPDPIEQAMVAEVAAGLEVVNLAGKLSLKEFGAVIERAELLVCVDSVSFHLANALKRPVVALFGPTSDVTWGPWQNPQAKVVAQNFSCRPCYQDGCGGSKHSDCLHTLPLELVQKAIVELERDSSAQRKSRGLRVAER